MYFVTFHPWISISISNLNFSNNNSNQSKLIFNTAYNNWRINSLVTDKDFFQRENLYSALHIQHSVTRSAPIHTRVHSTLFLAHMHNLSLSHTQYCFICITARPQSFCIYHVRRVCFENTDQIGIRQYHDRTRLVEDTYSKHTHTHTSRFHSSRQTCLLDAQMSLVYRSQNGHLAAVVGGTLLHRILINAYPVQTNALWKGEIVEERRSLDTQLTHSCSLFHL